MERLKRRIYQLKFITSMFRMAMEEFNNVMGPETIQTIFRLIGERSADEIIKHLKEMHHIDNWTIERLGELLVKDVIDPAVGEGKSEFKINNGELILLIKACPFKSAGIDITNKFYCTYTEGLIETIAKHTLKNINFETLKLRAIDKCDCEFKINLK